MSTPEARLSAAERAALANLESAATAADPHLAARLQGRAPAAALPFLVTVHTWVVAGWQWSLDRGWWGIPITVLGLFLVVLGVPYGFALSMFGLVISAIGLRVLGELVDRRWFSAAPPPH